MQSFANYANEVPSSHNQHDEFAYKQGLPLPTPLTSRPKEKRLTRKEKNRIQSVEHHRKITAVIDQLKGMIPYVEGPCTKESTLVLATQYIIHLTNILQDPTNQLSIQHFRPVVEHVLETSASKRVAGAPRAPTGRSSDQRATVMRSPADQGLTVGRASSVYATTPMPNYPMMMPDPTNIPYEVYTPDMSDHYPIFNQNNFTGPDMSGSNCCNALSGTGYDTPDSGYASPGVSPDIMPYMTQRFFYGNNYNTGM